MIHRLPTRLGLTGWHTAAPVIPIATTAPGILKAATPNVPKHDTPGTVTNNLKDTTPETITSIPKDHIAETVTDNQRGANAMTTAKLTAPASQILDIRRRIAKLRIYADVLDDHAAAVELAVLMNHAAETPSWDPYTLALVAYALGQQHAARTAAATEPTTTPPA